MTIRNILLMAFGVMILNTTTHAALTAAQCQTQCTTKDACRFAFKRKQCESDCKDVFSPESCTAAAPAPAAPTTSPVQKRVSQQPAAQPTISPKNPSRAIISQSSSPQSEVPSVRPKASLPATAHSANPPSSEASAPMPGAMNIVVDLAGADRPSPPPPAAPMAPETEQFFKQFSADFLSAGEALKCLTQSITVDEKQFKASLINRIKGTLVNPYKNLDYKPYADYKEYKADLGQYFESMVNLNIKEAFQQWSKVAMKAQEEFQGLITRGIRFAEGVAKKIPGYTHSVTQQAGADMMGPYLHALPNDKLGKLQECIKSKDEITHNAALKNFYKYFLAKIEKEIEQPERKDVGKSTKKKNHQS